MSTIGGLVREMRPMAGLRYDHVWMGSLRPRVAARLLASPILQEYDASTVELAVLPAEFGRLAARHYLVEIAEDCCHTRRGICSICDHILGGSM